jgi:SAM-dependent methyltransferase
VTISAGAIPSPNIWHHADIYELENRAVDPDGVLEATMRQVRPWHGATVLDIGCGSGYHLPVFAAEAAQVVGVEPHGDVVAMARRRIARLATAARAKGAPSRVPVSSVPASNISALNISVRHGAAQRLPVADASVDVAHARWAYFFGPGCEPGLREMARVVRRGGVGFIIDNDPTRSTFGRWFAQAYPKVDPAANDEFFSRHGWETLRRDIHWRFETRSDFEAVVRIEFAPQAAERIIAEHAGVEVDYAVVIRTRHF